MNKENLSKSIVLIGPSCVGKSLLAKHMKQKLNYKVFSIDDFLVCLDLAMDGYKLENPSLQEAFKEKSLRYVRQNQELSQNLNDDELKNATNDLIQGIVDMYLYYKSTIGDFKQFYKLLDKRYGSFEPADTPIENLCVSNTLIVKIMSKVLDSLNEPLIIDAPAQFGWCVDSSFISPKKLERLSRTPLGVDVDKNNEETKKILSQTRSVLLLPGEDYTIRNASRVSAENREILKHLENYYEGADLCVSTNGIFNEPQNKYFKKRSWFDAREHLKKRELMNNSEIANICDQVLIGLENLQKI